MNYVSDFQLPTSLGNTSTLHKWLQMIPVWKPVLISVNQTSKAMSICFFLVFFRKKYLRHIWMYRGTNGQSVSVSCQLKEVFKHFEWNLPLKRFDKSGLVLWYSLTHLKLSHFKPYENIYTYMFCMIWNNILWTHFFSKDICCIAYILVCTQILFNRIIASSFVFNCEYHSFRCKPQIKEPKSLYFVNSVFYNK